MVTPLLGRVWVRKMFSISVSAYVVNGMSYAQLLWISNKKSLVPDRTVRTCMSLSMTLRDLESLGSRGPISVIDLLAYVYGARKAEKLSCAQIILARTP